MTRICFFSTLTLVSLSVSAQDKPAVRMLDSVLIRSTIQPHLPEVQGVYIFSGKKTNDIVPDASGANLAGNNARMVFARIPGVMYGRWTALGHRLISAPVERIRIAASR